MAAVLAALMVKGTQTSFQKALPATIVQNQGKPEATFITSRDQRIIPAGIHPVRPNAAKSPNWRGSGRTLVTVVAESVNADSGATGSPKLSVVVVAFDTGSAAAVPDKISTSLDFSGDGGDGMGVVGLVFELGHSEKLRDAKQDWGKMDLWLASERVSFQINCHRRKASYR